MPSLDITDDLDRFLRHLVRLAAMQSALAQPGLSEDEIAATAERNRVAIERYLVAGDERTPEQELRDWGMDGKRRRLSWAADHIVGAAPQPAATDREGR